MLHLQQFASCLDLHLSTCGTSIPEHRKLSESINIGELLQHGTLADIVEHVHCMHVHLQKCFRHACFQHMHRPSRLSGSGHAKPLKLNSPIEISLQIPDQPM